MHNILTFKTQMNQKTKWDEIVFDSKANGELWRAIY